MKESLAERFKVFLSQLPGAEPIDSLRMPAGHGQSKRADYFLANRQIVCEVKSLETDTSWKVQRELDELRRRPDWPIVVGQFALHPILEKLPDGERIQDRIEAKATSSVGEAVTSANGQIASTKNAFGIPSARGLLVILNESIDVLSPEFIYARVASLFRKHQNGKPLFADLDAAFILSEAHYIQVGKERNGVLLIIENGSIEGSESVGDFAQGLMSEWAKHRRMTLTHLDDLSKLRSHPRRPVFFRGGIDDPEWT